MNYRPLLFILAILLFLGYCSAIECGDGKCEGGENQCNCPKDCGKCEGPYGTGSCSELGCVNGICTVIQKSNCCGNEKCESNETYGTCPSDCAPKSVDITVVSPLASEYFVYGETVNVLAEVYVDKTSKVIGADVFAKNPFKQITLYNDGKHGDGGSFDALYGNFFVVTKSMLGTKTVEFEASFRGVTGKASSSLVVRPDLNILVEMPSQVALGDIVDFKGTVKAKRFPVAIPLDVNISLQGKSVFEKTVFSDANSGAFSFSYPVSLLDKLGTYVVRINGIDGNGNTAFFERPFEVMERVSIKKLFIRPEPLEKSSFSRGEEIPIVVAVVDDSNRPVEKASVSVTAFGQENSLFEFSQGKYSFSVAIPFSALEGRNSLSLHAEKKDGFFVYEDDSVVNFNIEKIALSMEIVSPKDSFFKAGENLSFDVVATYPGGERVSDAKMFVLIGGDEMPLVQSEPGRFVGNYLLGEKDYAAAGFSLKLSDSFGNTALLEKKMNVSGETFSYFVSKNALVLGVVLIVVLVVGGFAAIKFSKRSARVSSKKKVSSYESRLKELQVNYFKKGIISRAEYDKEAQKIKDAIAREKNSD